MKKKILRLLLFVVIAYLVYAVVMMAYLFVTQRNLFKVSNNRMEPTLSEGAVVRYQKDFSELARGDLVVFKKNLGVPIEDIARVVAVENDTVEIAEGWLKINGEKTVQHDIYQNPQVDDTTITLDEHEVFLLNDNTEPFGGGVFGYEAFHYDEILGKVTECLNCRLSE